MVARQVGRWWGGMKGVARARTVRRRRAPAARAAVARRAAGGPWRLVTQRIRSVQRRGRCWEETAEEGSRLADVAPWRCRTVKEGIRATSQPASPARTAEVEVLGVEAEALVEGGDGGPGFAAEGEGGAGDPVDGHRRRFGAGVAAGAGGAQATVAGEAGEQGGQAAGQARRARRRSARGRRSTESARRGSAGGRRRPLSRGWAAKAASRAGERARLDLGVAVEQQEHVAGGGGEAAVGGGGEALRGLVAEHPGGWMARGDGGGGPIRAAVVDDDHLGGGSPRLQAGEAGEGQLAGVVGGDDDGQGGGRGHCEVAGAAGAAAPMIAGARGDGYARGRAAARARGAPRCHGRPDLRTPLPVPARPADRRRPPLAGRRAAARLRLRGGGPGGRGRRPVATWGSTCDAESLAVARRRHPAHRFLAVDELEAAAACPPSTASSPWR